jgi:hypothetical protein
VDAIDSLDAFSRRVAERLFEEHPEWAPSARLEVDDDGDQYLVVEVTPPVEANVDHPLLITTNDEEVTIGLDYYHCHFSDFTGSGDPALDGLAFLRAVVSDDVAVVSWWNGETWVGSSLLKRDNELNPMPHNPPFDCVRIRSWRGTRNRDL